MGGRIEQTDSCLMVPTSHVSMLCVGRTEIVGRSSEHPGHGLRPWPYFARMGPSVVKWNIIHAGSEDEHSRGKPRPARSFDGPRARMLARAAVRKSDDGPSRRSSYAPSVSEMAASESRWSARSRQYEVRLSPNRQVFAPAEPSDTAARVWLARRIARLHSRFSFSSSGRLPSRALPAMPALRTFE